MARTTPVNSGYTIINGTATGSNKEYVDVWLEWKLLSQDLGANTSNLHVILYAACTKSSSTAWNVAEKYGYVGYDGGNKKYRSTTYDFSDNAVNCFGDYTFTISHDNDGTKTVALEGGFTTHSTYISGGSVTASVTLPTIDRESTIKASDANIGTASTVTVIRRNSKFTHSIAYRFGSHSGWLNGSGQPVSTETKLTATSVSFPLPESFYDQIPDAKTGICTLTCKTWSGTKQIGEAQTCTFTVGTDKTLCAPAVSGTVEDSNPATLAVTGDKNKFVRGKSNALCTITATARKAASVKTKTIGGATVSGNSRAITGVDADAVVFSVTDSRGYTTRYKKTLSVIDYAQLTCNASVKRKSPTGSDAVLTIKGQCFEGSFGAVTNALTVTCEAGGKAVTVHPTISASNTYGATVTLTDLAYTQSYQVKVTVSDALSSVTKTLTLKTGKPVFDWGQKDFRFHVPVYFSGNTGLLAGKDMDNLTPGTYCLTNEGTVDTGMGVISAGALLDFPYLDNLNCRVQVVFPRDSAFVYIRHKWMGAWKPFMKVGES